MYPFLSGLGYYTFSLLSLSVFGMRYVLKIFIEIIINKNEKPPARTISRKIKDEKLNFFFNAPNVSLYYDPKQSEIMG